jgi:hypothetical protein
MQSKPRKKSLNPAQRRKNNMSEKESPTNHLIEELTKDRDNRKRIVRAICSAIFLISLGAAIGTYFVLKQVQLKIEMVK